MKKHDLKKLALLGIAGGLLVTPSNEIRADQDDEFLSGLMAAGCGKSGCSHQKWSGCGNTRPSSGCGSRQAGCGSNRPSAGCGNRQAGCGSNRPTAGCGSRQAGCGSNRGMIAISDNESANYQDNAGQLMTEDQLMSQLNEQGKQMYKGLSPEGKTLAIKLASRSCKGTNDCKGQGACKTADHSCAGKNSCAGTSKCSFKDKNLAVKVASDMQAQKRMQTSSGSY